MRALLLAATMLVATVPAHAQAVIDAVIARGTLKVGLTGDYKPFSIKDHDEIFRMLHDGSYLVRFSLTFGLSQIEYMVREPVGADVIASYQKCVAER